VQRERLASPLFTQLSVLQPSSILPGCLSVTNSISVIRLGFLLIDFSLSICFQGIFSKITFLTSVLTDS